MRVHFHFCEQCGDEFLCRQEWEACAVPRLCIDCAEEAASSEYEVEHQMRLRLEDEQRGRTKPQDRRWHRATEFDQVRRG